MAVAMAVGQKAITRDRNLKCKHSVFQHNNDKDRLRTLLNHMRWSPSYLPIELQNKEQV
jgi:hypothetical protein